MTPHRFVSALLLAILLLTVTGCITAKRAEQALGHQQLGQVYFDEGDVRGAVGEVQQSIELDPYIPESHHLLANCYFALQLYEKAASSYATATRLESSFPDAYVNWGAMLLLLEDWEEAVEKLTLAAEDPTYREAGRAYHNLGWAQYNLGRYEEARESYERVLRVTPLFCPSVYNLGLVAEAEGNLEEAERLYKRASDCNPKDLNTQMALGELNLRLDREEDARYFLDFVVAHDEEGPLGTRARQILDELAN